MVGIGVFYGFAFVMLLITAIVFKLVMQQRWDNLQARKTVRYVVPPRLLAFPDEYEDTYLHWFALGLAGKRPLIRAEVFDLAADPLLRHQVYHMLFKCEALDWFPAQFATMKMMAESHMVNWLYFPTELNCRPDGLELIGIEDVKDEGRPYRFYVFRFRVDPPHDQAEDGWMLGCVGPYMPYDGPLAYPSGTFSCFNKEGTTAPHEEAAWNFHNIYLENIKRQNQDGRTGL